MQQGRGHFGRVLATSAAQVQKHPWRAALISLGITIVLAAVALAFVARQIPWLWYGVTTGVIIGVLLGVLVVASTPSGVQGGVLGFLVAALSDLLLARGGTDGSTLIERLGEAISKAAAAIVRSFSSETIGQIDQAPFVAFAWAAIGMTSLIALVARVSESRAK